MSVQKLIPDFIALLLLLCLCSAAIGQPGKPDSAAGKPRISQKEFSDFEASGTRINSADAMLDSLQKASRNYGGDSLTAAYNIAKLRYDMGALDHRHRVFDWPLSSSRYIFVMVNIIVLVGLMLSIWQFYLPIYKMNKMMKQSGVAKEVSHTVVEDDNKEMQVSSIKLGKDGVEITSPVIGLLILVISIAFFFLYIHYVYPISEIAHP